MAGAADVGVVFEPLDEGGDALLAKTKSMAVRMANMTPALAVAVEGFHKIESEIWTSNGGKFNWAPLAQPTIDYKKHYGYPEETLWRTMSLMESLLGGEGSVELISPSLAIVGTNVHYAQYHQDGTETMPQREIIPDEATMLTLLTLAVESYLFTGAAAAVSDVTIANLA